MNAEILTVGTELLLGDITNSNSQFLSREMAVYGIDILYQSTVGDNRERLESALELALSRCDMVILTGGLGPTEDDLTRETVAKGLDIPLVLHEESDARIQEYFRSTGKEYTENNRKQAMLPEGCTVFQNDHGTAPGCAVEKDGKTVILLPGPPKELVPMFTDAVAPYLQRFSGETIRSHTIGVFGIPEAAVDERLHDLMECENPTVAPYAKDGEVQLRVTAKAASEKEADELCRPIIDEIEERLGTAVYGVNTGGLAKTVVEQLKERNKKIATAESCTAGLLSGKLTDVPGVSQVFECGIAAYSPEIKRQVLGVPEAILEAKGTVCPEVAAAMAAGARRVGGADIGIGITGVAGPEPSEGKEVGTVYVALADERRVWVKRIFTGGEIKDREQIRNAATLYALDMTRRYLDAYPGVMAGGQSLEKMTRPPAEPRRAPLPMHGKHWIWLSVFLVVVVALIVGAYALLFRPYQNRQETEDLNEIYNLGLDWHGLSEIEPGSVKYPDGMLSQFTGLYSINDDVRGWLTVEDTDISYPVVKNPSAGYYNGRNFYEKTSVYGTLHVGADTVIKANKANRSLVIYGNNPQNGQMFSELENFTELPYLKEHSTVEFSTLYRENSYKVFAVMLVRDEEVEGEDVFDYTVEDFATEEAFLEYVAQVRQRSLFDTPVDVQEGDDLLMLTAPIEYRFDDARIVVVARRVRTGEELENDLSKARVNKTVLLPEEWQDPENTTTDTTTTTVTTPASTTTTTTKKTTTTTRKTTTTTLNVEGDSLLGESTTSTVVSTTSRPTVTRPTSTVDKEEEPTPPPTDGTVQSKISEYDVMKYFVLKNSTNTTDDLKDKDGLVAPSTKEELHRLVAQVVKSELGSAATMVASTEAQKAQAVASYTYILWYNVTYQKPYNCSLKALDIKNSATDKKIYDAVGDVLGVKLLDLSKLAIEKQFCSTSYSASTGGYTASSNKVWTSLLPYAKSVESKYDNAASYAKYGGMGKFEVSETFTREELYEEIREWTQKNVLDKYKNYAMPEDQFKTVEGESPLRVLSYDGDGTSGSGDAWNYVFHTNFYYVDARGNKKPLTGHNIRQALGLRSHAFRVSYDAATDTVTITTQGWGHGVGLSQMGAVGYANEEGWNYVQILRHYFSVTDDTAHQVVTPIW